MNNSENIKRLTDEVESRILDGDMGLAHLSSDMLHLLVRAVEMLYESDEFEDNTHLFPIFDEILDGKYSQDEIQEMEQDGTFTPDIIQMNHEHKDFLGILLHALRELAMNSYRRESDEVKFIVKAIMDKHEKEAEAALPKMMEDIYKMLGEEK